jgi:hypothetical protein
MMAESAMPEIECLAAASRLDRALDEIHLGEFDVVYARDWARASCAPWSTGWLLLAVVPRVILLLMRSKIDMATRVVRCFCANALHFHCFVRLAVLALPITFRRRGEDQAPGRVKQVGQAGGQKSSNFLNFLSIILPHFPRQQPRRSVNRTQASKERDATERRACRGGRHEENHGHSGRQQQL